MFEPKFYLTKTLLSNIAQIERLYGQVEVLRIAKKFELNLEKNNLIKSSYISNSIEGNPLSLVEVTNLLLEDRIPINRDEKEIKNYFEILKSLTKYSNCKISLELIKDFHQKLLRGVNDKIRGNIRDKKIVIGRQVGKAGKTKLEIKHELPFHKIELIEKAVEDLMFWLDSAGEIPIIIRAGVFHHQFVYIHPFEDGNGRVCRLLTALIFLQNDYLINKYFVLDDYYDIDRVLYSDKLHSADKGDKTCWLEYFSDGVRHSLKGALSRIRRAGEILPMKERLTPKEKKVLAIFEKNRELTSLELAKKLNVSRQQAHNLLSSLVKKNILSKKGKTKASYYFLK